MGGRQAVVNREGIEYRADVSYMKLGRARIQVGRRAASRNPNDPQSKCLQDSRIVRVQAQRACCRKAVESYKGEGASMPFAVRGNELAIHKAHVSVKIIGSGVATFEVCARSSHVQISLADDATEISDHRRIMTSIGIVRIALDRTGEEEVDGCAKWSGNGMWNRLR